jgi:hypothetical protein
MNTNAMRLHMRRYGLLDILARKPRLFALLARRVRPA